MIDFSSKTYKNILDSMLSRVSDTLDKREGSVIQTALGPAAWYLEGLYFDLARIQNNVYGSTAGGKALDVKCVEWGLVRKMPTHAIKMGTFNVPVPIGARFSGINSTEVFKVVEQLGITEAGLHQYGLRCEAVGTVGNNYSGRLLAIDYINGLTDAVLTETIIEGTDEESDDFLRERLMNKIRRPSTSGNAHDYYNWAIECSGVGAAKIFPLAYGPGTVKVVIADTNKTEAEPALIKLVKNHIEELHPIGATVTVASVMELPINVMGKVKIGNGVNLGVIQASFQETLKDFLYESAFELSYVGIAKVGNILIETIGVEDYAEITLNGTSGNIVLTDEQIAVVGAVTLEVMT